MNFQKNLTLNVLDLATYPLELHIIVLKDIVLQKLKIFQKFCQDFNTDINILTENYTNQFFPETQIQKNKFFINLIYDDLSQEEIDYVDKVCNLPNKDKRLPKDYAKELVLSWLVEDLIKQKFNLKNNGSDSNREFLSSRKIKYDADFLFEDRTLELYVSWKSYWTKTGKIDLRLEKYNHLVQNKTILLGLSLEDSKFFLIDFSEDHQSFTKKFNWLWRKDCYTCENFEKFYDLHVLESMLEQTLKRGQSNDPSSQFEFRMQTF